MNRSNSDGNGKRVDTPGLNVFAGPNSIRDLLNPANTLPTPLVELPDSLNPLSGDRVRIFAKLAYLSPLLNIKALPALNMLLEAQANQQLNGVETIVENSSGNTVFSLAPLAALFGINRVVGYVPFDIAPGKLDMLRLAGVQPELKRGGCGDESSVAEAREAGRKPGHINLAQYDNPANPAAFEKWFAPELWKQTGGNLTVFAAGLGTTGTILGSSNYFRRCPSKVTIVACRCAPDEAIPGVRSEVKLRDITHNWASAYDALIDVWAKESYRVSMGLCRSALLAGPSSGFNLAGLHRFLETSKLESSLDKLRNPNGEVVAVFVCCDTPLPYLDKYSTYLEATEF